MKHTYAETKIIKSIAIIKWGRGAKKFSCLKCGNKKNNLKNYPFSIKCTKCNNIESATTGTAFENSHMPVHKKMAILKYIQKQFPNHIPTKVLAKKFLASETTINEFYYAIAKWRPYGFNEREYDNNYGDTEYVSDYYTFFGDVQSKFRNAQYALYTILIDWSEENYRKPMRLVLPELVEEFGSLYFKFTYKDKLYHGVLVKISGRGITASYNVSVEIKHQGKVLYDNGWKFIRESEQYIGMDSFFVKVLTHKSANNFSLPNTK